MEQFAKLQTIFNKNYGITFNSIESLLLQYRKKYSEDKQGIILIETYAMVCDGNASKYEISDKLDILLEYFIHKKAPDNIRSF